MRVQRRKPYCNAAWAVSAELGESTQVRRGCTREEVRAAYLLRIREVHPDVTGTDTNAEAANLNAAYEALMQVGRLLASPQE
jgi:hypothetical protein